MILNGDNKKFLLVTLTLLICGAVVFYRWPITYSVLEYSSDGEVIVNDIPDSIKPVETLPEAVLPPSSPTAPVTHIKTPDYVKAVYVSSWVAGSAKYRDPIIRLIDNTELNSIVIDIKDSTGRIGFQVSDSQLAKEGSPESRIQDIRGLTNLLHQKNIYIIGRVSVFQDPYMTKKRPEWAITRKSDGQVWKDRKGLSFLDPSNKEVWNYVVSIAHDSYNQGFDEINFDYIRYPSDGNIKDINYNIAKGGTRADNMEIFFKYLSQEVKKNENIPISGDLFGLTTEGTDDMGIGQVWEKALPHFDFLAPMVYPSHYPPGHSGYKNPALYPYEIIHKALLSAVTKTKAITGQDINKIRPWLQDFDMGAKYTGAMVKAQMKAVYDNGLNSWMLWDPNNKYTPEALTLETKP